MNIPKYAKTIANNEVELYFNKLTGIRLTINPKLRIAATQIIVLLFILLSISLLFFVFQRKAIEEENSDAANMIHKKTNPVLSALLELVVLSKLYILPTQIDINIIVKYPKSFMLFNKTNNAYCRPCFRSFFSSPYLT